MRNKLVFALTLSFLLLSVGATITQIINGGPHQNSPTASPTCSAYNIIASASGNVVSIGLNVSSAATGQTAYFIYADSGGSPSTLLWTSGVFFASSNQWNDQTVTRVAFVLGTQYWLGFTMLASATQMFNDSSGGQRAYTFVGCTDPFGSPAGPIDGHAANMRVEIETTTSTSTTTTSSTTSSTTTTSIIYSSFNEIGLPSATSWNVIYDSLLNSSTTSNIVFFSTIPGNFAFSIPSQIVSGDTYFPDIPSGFLIAGNNQDIVFASTTTSTSTTSTSTTSTSTTITTTTILPTQIKIYQNTILNTPSDGNDLATIFMLASIALVVLRFYFYKESSAPLITILLVSGILFMFGTYFAIVPFQTHTSISQTTYNATNVLVGTIVTNTTGQTAPSLYPQWQLTFLFAMIYELAIAFWVLNDVMILWGRKIPMGDFDEGE